jgi:hypothetical protein
VLPNIMVSQDGDKWAVRREGTEAVINRHGTLEEALDAGRQLARQSGVELVWVDESGETHRESQDQESGASTEGTVSAKGQGAS